MGTSGSDAGAEESSVLEALTASTGLVGGTSPKPAGADEEPESEETATAAEQSLTPLIQAGVSFECFNIWEERAETATQTGVLAEPPVQQQLACALLKIEFYE